MPAASAQISTMQQESIMGQYIDGFVLPVPKSKVEAYKAFSEKAGAIWREHGARNYIECLADDVKPGKVTSFPQAVKLKDDETVVFAWIVYDSREHRDSVNAKVMKDPRMADMDPKTFPFDGMRLIWGGFEVFVDV
jgi:uncharacterized protein YbaA (DUF1428 family)